MRGTVTGQRYVDDLLRPHVGPFLNGLPGAIFRQDNACPHTARVAQDFQRHFQTLPWPARSPDLSPVEHYTRTTVWLQKTKHRQLLYFKDIDYSQLQAKPTSHPPYNKSIISPISSFHPIYSSNLLMPKLKGWAVNLSIPFFDHTSSSTPKRTLLIPSYTAV
ncbi:DDE_3 domain-containing protein [Trichonephila clavipes]|uniref:DDE_3 domain-containing protein n=1 Tax=Trichonephila clavipes TaxID=2585209 RepID=A0A8X7BG41_TRICX|nr:DDE_3 domain-containing protein [Trichonephila clavipes]